MSRMIGGRKIRFLILKILFKPADDILKMAQLDVSMVRSPRTRFRVGRPRQPIYRCSSRSLDSARASQEGADRVQAARKGNR